jgi:hypothetical protein
MNPARKPARCEAVIKIKEGGLKISLSSSLGFSRRREVGNEPSTKFSTAVAVIKIRRFGLFYESEAIRSVKGISQRYVI